jgi:hypothetical protein
VKNQLPPIGTRLQYRIRDDAEPHDRVVTEEQLSRSNRSPNDGQFDSKVRSEQKKTIKDVNGQYWSKRNDRARLT